MGLNVHVLPYVNELLLRQSDFPLKNFCRLAKQANTTRNFIIWPALGACKMSQIARCNCLLKRAGWSHLARSGLPSVSRKQNFSKSHIINPLLTKFVPSRWLDIGLVLFSEFMDLDFVSVHKHAKKELGQYPAILTSHLVNNPYIKNRF